MINEEIITKVPEVFRDGDYWLAADGKIYRGDEHIGTRDELGAVAYAEGMAKYKNRVGRLLNSVAIAIDAGGLPTPKEPEEVEPKEPVPSPSEVVPEPKEDEVGIDSPEAFEKAFEVITHKLEPEPEPEVVEDARTGAQIWAEEIVPRIEAAKCDWPEGAPPTDYRGDKTPEFVEWYIKHYPEKAVLRYLGRKFHLN